MFRQDEKYQPEHLADVLLVVDRPADFGKKTDAALFLFLGYEHENFWS
jgi:hypothetical protein